MIAAAGSRVVDVVFWEKSKVQEANALNNHVIRNNVQRLSIGYPEQAPLFTRYLQNQEEESRDLETEYTCATLLIAKE